MEQYFCVRSICGSRLDGAASKHPVDTPGGTAGTIPEFWGASTIGKSVITQNQQRVGIGTKNVTFFDPLAFSQIPGVAVGSA